MRTKKTVALLQARIDQLEAQAATANEEPRASRRGMLRLAGAAAVGGLAAAVTSQPAAAVDPNDVVLNLSTNPGLTPTGIAMQPTAQAYGLGCYENGLGALDTDLGRPAVFGHATGSAFTTGVAGHTTVTDGAGVFGLDEGVGTHGAGVEGRSTAGIGVWGTSYGGGAGIGVRGDASDGTAVAGFCDGLAGGGIGLLGSGRIGLYGYGPGGALQLVSYELAAPPSRTTEYATFIMDTDDDGNVWYCYEGGEPGKWRKLAGPASAGTFHAIAPTRVYDSRAAAPTPGPLAAGNNRLVSVADGRDGVGVVNAPNIVPAGATAVAANVTITRTTGASGFLTVNPGGAVVATSSTINWFGAGQTLANGVTLSLNSTREVTVICGGTSGSTHFIIDIAGYYL